MVENPQLTALLIFLLMQKVSRKSTLKIELALQIILAKF